MKFEEELMVLMEKEKLNLKDILEIFERALEEKIKIKEVLPDLLYLIKEKEGSGLAFEFLKIIKDEKYKLKFEEEELLNYFKEIYKEEEPSEYLNTFKKEIKKEPFKYLGLIEKLLKFKVGTKIFYNKKKGTLEGIDFEDRKYKIKMEDSSSLDMAFILAPDKLEILELETGRDKDKYLMEPHLFIEKIKEEKQGIDFEFFKAKAKEVFGEDFEKWFSSLPEKMGFLIFKKEKQYIKFFKNFSSFKEFIKRFEKNEFFAILEKNIKNLKIFREEILNYIKEVIKLQDLEVYLNFLRIKSRFEGSPLLNFKELLSKYPPLEIYRSLRSREEKKDLIDEFPDNKFLEAIILFEEDFKVLDKILKKLVSRENINNLIFITDKNPALFISLLNYIEKEDFKEVLLEHKKFFLYKALNSMIDPSFSKFQKEARDLWSKKSITFLLKNSPEEIEDFVQIIEDKKEEAGFPYTALKAKIEPLYPGIFEEKKQEILCLKASFEKKGEELKKMLEEIPQVRKMITQARELGDLRENFEYKSARERYEFLQSMVYKLKEELKRVKIIKKEEVDLKTASFGTKIELKGLKGETKIIQILGPYESDPENNIFSYEAEGLRGIIGKVEGSEVELFGERFKIEKIDFSDLF